MAPDQLLTVRETAERLHVNWKTVHHLVDDGHLSAVNIGRGRQRYLRITGNSIDEFIARGGVPVKRAAAVADGDSHG